jgi:hypothetical protein
MKEIPTQMFVASTGLKKVIIPEGIKTIGESAFHTCPKLREVNIPASVTTIGPGCFAGSFDPEAKVSITVPETVKEVGWASFENTGLREVIWKTKAKVVEAAMFNLSFYLENVEFCGEKITESHKNDPKLFCNEAPAFFHQLAVKD